MKQKCRAIMDVHNTFQWCLTRLYPKGLHLVREELQRVNQCAHNLGSMNLMTIQIGGPADITIKPRYSFHSLQTLR